MKKKLSFLPFVALALLFASCNKKYTCTCVVDQANRAPQIVSDDLGSMSSGDAEYNCDVFKANLQASPGVTADCHI